METHTWKESRSESRNSKRVPFRGPRRIHFKLYFIYRTCLCVKCIPDELLQSSIVFFCLVFVFRRSQLNRGWWSWLTRASERGQKSFKSKMESDFILCCAILAVWGLALLFWGFGDWLKVHKCSPICLMMNPEITDIYTTPGLQKPRVVASVAVCLWVARTKFPPVFALCCDPSGISLRLQGFTSLLSLFAPMIVLRFGPQGCATQKQHFRGGQNATEAEDRLSCSAAQLKLRLWCQCLSPDNVCVFSPLLMDVSFTINRIKRDYPHLIVRG